jgi:hypothetical protein
MVLGTDSRTHVVPLLVVSRSLKLGEELPLDALSNATVQLDDVPQAKPHSKSMKAVDTVVVVVNDDPSPLIQITRWVCEPFELFTEMRAPQDVAEAHDIASKLAPFGHGTATFDQDVPRFLVIRMLPLKPRNASDA